MSGNHSAVDISAQAADPTRRTFLKAAAITAVGAAAVSTGVVTLWSMRDPHSGTPQTYAFGHAEDIALWVGNGERFTIKVLHGKDVIEEHTGVLASRIRDLQSEYFTTRYISAPTAA